MDECQESVRLCRQWSAIAGAFLLQGVSIPVMNKDPEYDAAYQAYFNHQMTCPVCRARRHAVAEALKDNPVYPVPDFVMSEDL